MRRSFPSDRGPAEGSAEGGIRLFSEGSLLPSDEAEMRRAAGGLGGEASGEAEIALRLARPRTSHALVLGRGPSMYLDLWPGCLIVFAFLKAF